MQAVLKEQFSAAQKKMQEILANTRYISLGLDIWTKKSFTASFLGVSACFFNPLSRSVQHVFLNLHQLDHPHTGACCSVIS